MRKETMLCDPKWQDGQTKIDLSKPSLQALAYILRHRELWPEGFRWEFTDCTKCAMGLAIRLWHIHDSPCTGTMCEYFPISRPEAHHLFLGYSHPSITPEMVADRIESY